MHLVNCLVKHGGQHHNHIQRISVTVPEILVLRAIHGSDALIDITFAGTRQSETDEWDRLVKHYGHKEDSLKLLSDLFPGMPKRLPTTLDEIDMGDLVPAAPVKAAKPEPKEGEIIASPGPRRRVTSKKAAPVAEQAEALG